MKRNLALLLAGVMTAVSVPINIFAQDTFSTGRHAVTRLSRSVMLAPNRTAFVEQGVTGPGGEISGEVRNSDRIQHWVEGGNFNVVFEEDYITDSPVQFTLELDNAQWFFRNQGGPDTGNLGVSTFNSSNGTWDQATNTYTRTATTGTERTYTMQVSTGDPRRATVTITGTPQEAARGATNTTNNDTTNNTANTNANNTNNTNDTNTNDTTNSDTTNNNQVVQASTHTTPENKTQNQENKEKPIKEVPQNQEKPMKEIPQNKEKEKPNAEQVPPAQGQHKEKEETKPQIKLPSIKPVGETPTKEKPSTNVPEATKPQGETPTKETPKTPQAAVPVVSIPVDAMSTYDDITRTAYTNLEDALREVRAAESAVGQAQSAISVADQTIAGVRTPVDNAQTAVTNAQGYLAAETPIGNVNTDLTTAYTRLGEATAALDAMVTTDDTDPLETTGTNYDALNTALGQTQTALGTAATAIEDAIPPDNGNGNDNGNGTTGGGVRNGEVISIPLVVRTTEENADASIRVTQANPVPIETTRRVFAQATQGGLTTTTVPNPRTGRDRLEIPSIGVLENRIGALPESGTFEIVAPSGFAFATLPSGANVSPEGGVGRGTGWTSNIELRNDATVARVTYSGLTRSTRMTGSLSITGLTLVSTNTDSVREGDVYLSIRNVGNPAVVTPQRFLAGTVSDWRVSMEVIGEPPKLINGKLNGVERTDISDQYHKAASVRVEERVENAWWAQRSTTFTLPEQVRVRKVEFREVRNVSNYEVLEGSFYNDRNRTSSANVRVNDNVVTISGLQTNNAARASFEMDLWLNIESGFEDDINLTIGGSAITDQNADQYVKIATAVNPVKVNVEKTNVRIGYQFVPVGDFTIVETVPGALPQGEQVFISITDNMFSDMHIASGFEWDITKGDLRVRNMRTGTNLGLNNNNNNNVNVSFEIDRASTEASEMKFSKVQVRMAGNAPVSNQGVSGYGYDLVVWGPAIAANFEGVKPDDNEVNRNDFFREPGIRAKFVNVEGVQADGVLTNVVSVTADSPVIKVNGEEMLMDTAPFISTRSDSMMVPVRFVSMGLGVEPNRVLWSPDTSTVTIDAGSRIIQFQTNSSMMRINGIEVPMLNANGQPVYSEVRDERAFIPFRALGEALNVHVSWNPQTATATFDPTVPTTRGQGFAIEEDYTLPHYGNYNQNQNVNNNDNNQNTSQQNTDNNNNYYYNQNQNDNGQVQGQRYFSNPYTNYYQGKTQNKNMYTNGLNSYNRYQNIKQSTTKDPMQTKNRGMLSRTGYVQTRQPNKQMQQKDKVVKV